MNRIWLERFKMVETMRIPILGKYWYLGLSALDQKKLEAEKIPQQPLNREAREEIIICSMTSFPARIEYVHLAIKSLMLQTCKPDKILLWLAEEQFPERKLPQSLFDLRQYGLETCWCHDMYGHKKYFYPVKNQKPNEVVITYDDDIIYSPLSIERLMRKHKEFPGCLVCERGQIIDSRKENINNPGRWKTISLEGVGKPTYRMNPSPGGGCLLPYGCFAQDALNEEKFRALAYKNDDLWYMFMCAENRTQMVKTRCLHRLFTLTAGSQTTQMAAENVIGEKNVEIMKGLQTAYPQAWNRIITDED